jgi:hypothetical protein
MKKNFFLPLCDNLVNNMEKIIYKFFKNACNMLLFDQLSTKL